MKTYHLYINKVYYESYYTFLEAAKAGIASHQNWKVIHLKKKQVNYYYENFSGESVFNTLTEEAQKKFGELVKNIHHVDTHKSIQSNSMRIQGWIELPKFLDIMQKMSKPMSEPVTMTFQIKEDKVEILIWVIDEMYLQ